MLKPKPGTVRATVEKLTEIGNSLVDIHEKTGLPFYLIEMYVNNYKERKNDA